MRAGFEDVHAETFGQCHAEAVGGEEPVSLGRPVTPEAVQVVADDVEMTAGSQSPGGFDEDLGESLGSGVEVGDPV